jgi:tyrosine-protein kinase Etk/Wzc
MSTGNESGELDLFDLFAILMKRRRLIGAVTLFITAFMAIVGFTMKPIYRAETKIIPPTASSSSSAAMLVSQLGLMPGAAGVASPAIRTTSDLYIEMLKSRTILDRMVDRFDLMKRYGIVSRASARKILADAITTRNSLRSGVITITVDDPDPVRASDMANGLVEELRKLNNGLSITEAAQRRLFFEEQLGSARDALSRAEDAMKAFQEKTGVVRLDTQADAAITGMSSLKAQIAAKEVQIRAMKTYSTDQNPDLVMAREELSGLNDQLKRLEARGGEGGVTVPAGSIASTGAEYLRLARDLKFNETLYSLLMSQYQAAKLDEARDAVVIQVLDKAAPPEFRVKPNRKMMIVSGAVIGIIGALMLVGFIEYWGYLRRSWAAR